MTLFRLHFKWFIKNNQFFARKLSPGFFSLTDDHRATPFQDTAQRRHRRRRVAGTRSKDSFQIKTLRKPFLLSLVDNIPQLLFITEEEAGVLAFGHVRILRVPGHQGLITKGNIYPCLHHKDKIP